MKKKVWTLSPYFLIFSGVILGMALYSIRWNIYIFYMETAVAILSILLVYVNLKRFEHYTTRVVKNALAGIKGVNTSYLEKFSVPVVVAGVQGDVVWYNSRFKARLCSGREATGDFISQYIPGFTVDEILNHGSADVSYGNRRYTVLACSVTDGAVLYFIDDTYYKNTAKEFVESRPSVAMVVFDNREEFERDNNDEQSAHAVVTIENALQKWAAKYNALFKKVSGSRYMVIFEERFVRRLVEEKFPILEEIRSIKFANNREATISIGIGRGAQGFRESELWARRALEMALGRGGDQVAVKTKDEFRFFGGVSKGFEKFDKVRTRVIASTLSEHIKGSSHVLLMGHKNSDLDCVGASIGLWSAVTKALQKPAHVVVRKEQSLARPLIDSFLNAGGTNIFMEPEEALGAVNDKTLLIVMDTHSPAFLESTEIYQKCRQVVVIDHHRMMVNRIENSVVFFHEPYASSASEMATELVQYLGDNVLTRLEAEALLSGIMLDTKNFVLKTGVRTFEAAAYLRQCGADTVEVKRLFSNSIDAYKAKYQLVSQAEIYNSCAIACTEDVPSDVRVTAAQAADELLGLQDVRASFVIYSADGCINVSARSLGDVNVQVIMEQLGGGGHQTMAGAQIEGQPLSAVRDRLIEIVSQIDS